MPLFEMEATRRGRLRVFMRAQFPFIVGTVFILVVAAIAHPMSLSTPVVITGSIVTAVATGAAALVPWEKLTPSWLIPVAMLDILAVALLRAELTTYVPAVTILSLFPILWLAYGFPWYGIVVGVTGAVFVTSFRFVYLGEWPETRVEWATVVAFPALVIGIAVIVFIAARQLRRNTKRLAEASRAQAIALGEAKDAGAIALGILNTVTAGVAFYDSNGKLDVANHLAHQMVEMVGFRLDEPPYAGDNVLAADRLSRIPYDQQIIPRALRGEIIDNHMEWVGPSDAQVAIMASSGQVHREDGHLLGTVVVAYDVTELADAVEVREQFLRTVSHELRTPITSITGFLDLIADAADPADTKLRSYVEIVTRKTNDLFNRVGELLHANDSTKTLKISDLDVRRVAHVAADNVGPLAAAQGARIDLSGPGPIWARADGDQLVIAVSELLTNAIKFGTPGSPIALAYRARAGEFEITVTNEGQGITHAEQRRVFDRFYRTPYARSREIQGFGLGLTNVRAIAAAHGGYVHIDSTPDHRTTVSLSFPLQPSAV